MKSRFFLILIAKIIFLGLVFQSYARDQLYVSGSSTVFPYAKVTAETFGDIYSNYKTPIIESTGTGPGIKQFCQGSGENTLDIVNASRPMSRAEFETCLKNGVLQIGKITFGYDGIVLASSRNLPLMNFTPSDLYKALASQVVVNGRLTKNPYTYWSQINSEFPEIPVKLYIPGHTQGTREIFEQKILYPGCISTGAFAAYQNQDLSAAQAELACTQVRKDGLSIDIEGDYSETLARLNTNKSAFGVFGLFYYQNNSDKLNAATIEGVFPTSETIASRKYPISRPLFFYIKNSHLGFIPGLKEYISFFLMDQVIGEEGSLLEYGLVPSSAEERKKQKDNFENGLFLKQKDFST